jgi:hypothetical protein
MLAILHVVTADDRLASAVTVVDGGLREPSPKQVAKFNEPTIAAMLQTNPVCELAKQCRRRSPRYRAARGWSRPYAESADGDEPSNPSFSH